MNAWIWARLNYGDKMPPHEYLLNHPDMPDGLRECILEDQKRREECNYTNFRRPQCTHLPRC